MLSAVRILFDLAMMNSNLLSLGKLREIHFLCSTNWKKMENLHAHRRGIIVYIENQCLFLRRNWVPHPLPGNKCVPHLDPLGWATLACGWGGGGTHDWTESLTLCILYDAHDTIRDVGVTVFSGCFCILQHTPVISWPSALLFYTVHI